MVVGAIVGGVAALGICGYFGYRMLFGGESPNRIATSEQPASTVPAPPPVTEPPKDSAPVPQPSTQDTAPTQSTPAIPPDSEAKSSATDAKSVTSAGTDPNKASATKDASKAAGTTASMKDSTKDSSKAPPVVPGSPPSTTDTSKAGAPARDPAQQTAQVDRWKLMKDAMSRCGGETFFKRVACEQAVGLQYCEGYWGRVPQCPSGPPKDRGQ
jgi:cytoskeletal protein RodZ